MRSKINISCSIILLLFLSMQVISKSQQKINLSEYKVQRSNNYRYALKINQLLQLQRESESKQGVLFNGNFSTFILKDRESKQFLYESQNFRIRWPSLHEFAQINSQLIQLQITYRIKLLPQFTAKPAYSHVIVSFLFMVSQYLPEKDLSSMIQFIKSINNQRNIDLRQIIRQQITGPVFVYPAKSLESSTLRIIRKQLRLIGKKELQKLAEIGSINKKEKGQKIVKPQKIYEFKSFIWNQNQNDL